MRAVITGAAGFVGSHLAEALVASGADVVGIDSFTSYYDPARKRANVAALSAHERFELVEDDLVTLDLSGVLGGVDVVFHQAAQPGVRLSWADGFGTYDRQNILATQRLLEAAKAAGIQRFVYASSSSIYGNAVAYPTTEDMLPRPHSPYGVTKLAAEHLCGLYAANWGVPTVALRYFTVYGPRQRPDMAMHRLIEAALTGTSFPLYGDGSAVRDFTFVGDVVAANVLAGGADVAPGTVVNIAGGTTTAVGAVIDLVSELVGRPVPVQRHAEQPGDVDRTGGAIALARSLLGWEPVTDVAAGVSAQVAWHRSRARVADG